MDIERSGTRAGPRGQTLVEYVLILAAMMFVAGAAGLIGHKSSELVNNANSPLQQQAAPAPGNAISASQGSVSINLSSVHQKDSGEGEDSK